MRQLLAKERREVGEREVVRHARRTLTLPRCSEHACEYDQCDQETGVRAGHGCALCEQGRRQEKHLFR